LAERHTTPADVLLIEASANTFAVDLWRVHTGQCSADQLGLR
jgi:hypothetical protein